MRELKFRCWSPDNQEMYFPDGNYSFRMFNSGVSFEPYFNADELQSFHTDPEGEEYLKKIEVMQYTGLKDRNGIEIYEGDIVKHIKYSTKNIGVVTFGEGEYNPDHWSVSWHGWFVEGVDCTFDEYDAMDHFEVIGNIYQNPELLNPA